MKELITSTTRNTQHIKNTQQIKHNRKYQLTQRKGTSRESGRPFVFNIF